MKRGIRVFWTLVLVCVSTMMLTMASWAAAKTQLGASENVYWDEDEMGLARWEKVEKAKKYEVILYEGQLMVKKLETSGTKLDLKEYMVDGGLYSFKVRAIPTTSQKSYSSGEWVYSDEMGAENVGVAGRWRTYSTGKKFQMTDSSEYAVNGWYQIQGSWYYFDANGYVQTGWQNIDQVWYYLDGEGIMQTGWIQLDDVWYYLEESGAMKTGWVESKPGFWYYLDGNGAMLVDTVVDGHQLDATGLRVN